MATIRQFEDIDGWKEARIVCIQLGKIIDAGRFKNNFELIKQIEGSSGSIMDNIAEGFERGSRGEFLQFLGYAKGSCGELRSQLYRAFDRNYISQKEFDNFKSAVVSISRRIQEFIRYLQTSKITGVRNKDK